MKIILVAATMFEIRPTLEHFGMAGLATGKPATFITGVHQVDVLVTGVGMVATAFHLGRQLLLAPYDWAVNAGIAGSFNPGLPPGTLVRVKEDIFADLGAESPGGFKTLSDMKLTRPDDLALPHGRLQPLEPAGIILPGADLLEGIPEATALTTNTIRTTSESLAWLRKIAQADIESMEGAAFYYACRQSNVPCLQLRCISNVAGEADHKKWETSMAITRLNDALKSIFSGAQPSC